MARGISPAISNAAKLLHSQHKHNSKEARAAKSHARTRAAVQARLRGDKLAVINASLAAIHEILEQELQKPVPYRGQLTDTAQTLKGRGKRRQPGRPDTATAGGDEGEPAPTLQSYSPNTDPTSQGPATNLVPGANPHSVPQVIHPQSQSEWVKELQLEMDRTGARVPGPITNPDIIWQFVSGAESIEDPFERLCRYQAAMRAYGRYYQEQGETDRAFQVMLLLTNQMKDTFIAHARIQGLKNPTRDVDGLDAEAEQMSDEDLAKMAAGEMPPEGEEE